MVIADEFEMPGGMRTFYTRHGEHPLRQPPGAARDSVPGDAATSCSGKVMKRPAATRISCNHRLSKAGREDSEAGDPVAIFKTDNGYADPAPEGRAATDHGRLLPQTPPYFSSLSPSPTASVTITGLPENQNNTGDGIKGGAVGRRGEDITNATMMLRPRPRRPAPPPGYTEGESVKASSPRVAEQRPKFSPARSPSQGEDLRGELASPSESADYDYRNAAAQRPGGVYISVWDSNFGDDVQRFPPSAARRHPHDAYWA